MPYVPASPLGAPRLGASRGVGPPGLARSREDPSRFAALADFNTVLDADGEPDRLRGTPAGAVAPRRATRRGRSRRSARRPSRGACSLRPLASSRSSAGSRRRSRRCRRGRSRLTRRGLSCPQQRSVGRSRLLLPVHPLHWADYGESRLEFPLMPLEFSEGVYAKLRASSSASRSTTSGFDRSPVSSISLTLIVVVRTLGRPPFERASSSVANPVAAATARARVAGGRTLACRPKNS